ncbi:MAG: diguanylate cyclase [Acidimicrobiales bacterium]
MRPVRWFQELKPHVKVGLVTVVLVASGLAVLAVSVTHLSQVRGHVDTLANRAQPASTQLRAIDQSLELTSWKFSNILTEEDPAARVVALEDTRRQLSQNDGSWRRFKELSLDLPGERDLWARFEADQARQRDLAGPVGFGLLTGLMSGRDPAELFADPTFEELRQTQRRMTDTVRELEQRYYDPLVEAETAGARVDADTGRRDVLIAYAAVMVVSLVLAAVAFRSAQRAERRRVVDAQRRAQESRRNELEAKLYRALEMAQTEQAAYALVGQALVEALEAQPAELLVADASVAHFRQVLSTDAEHGGPGCPVMSPKDCPAALRGDQLVFPSSAELDACPFLRERSGPPCAAVCQPVSIAGKSLGVVHATFPAGQRPEHEALVELELVARRAGDRIGMLRLFAETESQARSDPLTGLLNRRSLENTVRRLVHDGTEYVVAYGDLDRFKDLNDTHGHDVGDRALRLFSRALRDSIRPNDLACRYGGEEFVLVLPECRIEEAVGVLERVRAALVRSLDAGHVPPFTTSFGVASSHQADTFDRVVALADAALLQAKAAGRDRVVVSGLVQPALPAGSPRELGTPGG